MLIYKKPGSKYKNYSILRSFVHNGELEFVKAISKFNLKNGSIRNCAPYSLVCFALFAIGYVSFVMSKNCEDSVSEFCADNVLLDGKTTKLSPDEVYSEKLNLQQNDSRLLEFIRDHHLLPPSSFPYNLKSPDENPAEFKAIIEFVIKTLSFEPPGPAGFFFVEAGAHDGEYMSNTLTLEKDYGWTGLLVEPDPIAFSKLRQKNRKAWLSNVCLSVTDQPQEVKFHLNKEFPVLARIPSDDNIYEWSDSITEEVDVKCLPIFSILSALNVTTVDFFSLDIEGAEMKVLQSIPFHSVYIKIFVIEHMWLMDGRKALVKFMTSKGYKWIRRILFGGRSDSIFVHKAHITAMEMALARERERQEIQISQLKQDETDSLPSTKEISTDSADNNFVTVKQNEIQSPS